MPSIRRPHNIFIHTRLVGRDVEMHLPSNSYVVVFINNNSESKRVKSLVDRTSDQIQQIHVKSHDDIPRLVTEERVFSGFKEIEEYCKVWLSTPK